MFKPVWGKGASCQLVPARELLMCNIRKETWKRRKGKKEVYIFFLFKQIQRGCVTIFFTWERSERMRKSNQGMGKGEIFGAGGTHSLLPPTVKSLVLDIVSHSVCDFFLRKKKNYLRFWRCYYFATDFEETFWCGTSSTSFSVFQVIKFGESLNFPSITLVLIR